MNFSEITTLLKNGEDQIAFYLNKPNKYGWGVVYSRVRIGKYLMRFSTGVRVKSTCWSQTEGRIILPSMGDIDRRLHEVAGQKLRDVKQFWISNFSLYFCTEGNNLTTKDMYYNLKDCYVKKFNVSVMTNDKKCLLSPLLNSEAFKIENPKTQRSVLGIVSNFKRFLNAAGIEDSIENVNQKTMRQYLVWLQDPNNGISIARGKVCINYIYKLLQDIENSHGYEFNLNRSIAKSYKETRSMEERRKNSVALTEEEINKLASLELEGKLKVARDVLLLQCFCGFRFEDLSRLLDSKNLREFDGVMYSVFTTQKKDIVSHTPLNHPDYYPQAYEIYKAYKDKSPYTDKSHDLYNRRVREIAKLAKLDREITVTKTLGTRKVKKTYKVYEVLSSHDGRHTFITNCIRYRGIDHNILKNITGHSDSKLIETIYCNLESEDKLKLVHGSKSETPSKDKETELGINGIREAKSVLMYLGVRFDDDMNFDELVKLIEERHYILNEKFGIPITLLKDIFNLSLPLRKRIDCLRVLLRELYH